VDSPDFQPRRTLARTATHILRRAHMYAGLFLLPWSVLYGVTAFLFNHPTAFSDQPYVEFGRDVLAGTPMEAPPSPSEVAERVISALRTQKPGTSYSLVEPDQAKFTREFAFAIVRAEGRETNVLIDVTGAGGSVRSGEVPPPKIDEPAPFAIGGTPRPGPVGPSGPPVDALKFSDPLHERVKAAIPIVLERTGFAGGDVTVTSVPDLSFQMDADGRRWRVMFNAQTGTVSGRLTDTESPTPSPSTRASLLRLHTAHGYPYRTNSRWAWAVVVDAMAAVLVFWGASGLVMWWQVKAARRVGGIIILAGAVAATALTFAMLTAASG
jgi:hypothetical protein